MQRAGVVSGCQRLSSALITRRAGTAAARGAIPQRLATHPCGVGSPPPSERRQRGCWRSWAAARGLCSGPRPRAVAPGGAAPRGEMFVLGLTGSIGMGKSTVSAMFAEKGVPVMDSDAVVHRLYAPGGAAVSPVQSVFPDAIVDGGIDRAALSKYVIGKEGAMKQLEAIVHPLVEQERLSFLKASERDGHTLVVLDIPLLYETKAESKVDAVAVVSAGAEAQKERVLARPGMTEEKFNQILSRQVPDEEKRRRADHVINTGQPAEETKKEVDLLVNTLASRPGKVAASTPAVK